jgi:hypothetical protein
MSETWAKMAPRVRVVAPVRVDPEGRNGPTKAQAAGPGWRRTSSGLHVPAQVSADLAEQRIVEQGARLHRGAITGWAALRLQRAGYLDGLARDGRTPLPVQVAANGDRLRSSELLEVHRVAIAEEDVVIRYGVRCAIPERAVFDAMRWSEDLVDRVIAMDMAAAAELTSVLRTRAYVMGLRDVHDRMLVVGTLGWCDEDAASPAEVRLRLIWRRLFDGAPPLANRVVLSAGGRRLGTPDLVSERLGMGAEFDGEEHRKRARHRRDVRRLDEFLGAGLEMATFVGQDLDDEELVVARLAATARRAGRLERTWKLAPAGPSLDERLDLRDHLRNL